jgi:hypothetical protein
MRCGIGGGTFSLAAAIRLMLPASMVRSGCTLGSVATRSETMICRSAATYVRSGVCKLQPQVFDCTWAGQLAADVALRLAMACRSQQLRWTGAALD